MKLTGALMCHAHKELKMRSRVLISMVAILAIFIVVAFFACTKKTTDNEQKAVPGPKKITSPGSSTSLFFVRGDSVYRYDYISGYYHGGLGAKLRITYSPTGLEALPARIFQEKGIQLNDIVSFNAQMTVQKIPSTIIYDDENEEEVKLIKIRARHRGWDEYDFLGLAPYPALCYDKRKRTLTLSNGFEGRACDLDFPVEHRKGIPLNVQRRVSAGSKFGEPQYKMETVLEDTIPLIQLDKIDFICFGRQGLMGLCNKFQKDIYATEHPFLYKLQRTEIDPLTFGAIKLESSPSGARVFIDGINRGRTPVLLDSMLAITHRIYLKKDYYQPSLVDVRVYKDSTVSVTSDLRQYEGWWKGNRGRWNFKISQEGNRLAVEFLSSPITNNSGRAFHTTVSKDMRVYFKLPGRWEDHILNMRITREGCRIIGKETYIYKGFGPGPRRRYYDVVLEKVD